MDVYSAVSDGVSHGGAPPSSREAATTSIEDAGRRLGISRSLSYQLARENRFPVPVIRAGRRLLIPTAALERLLNGETGTCAV
jgi:hypothetical protein